MFILDVSLNMRGRYNWDEFSAPKHEKEFI